MQNFKVLQLFAVSQETCVANEKAVSVRTRPFPIEMEAGTYWNACSPGLGTAEEQRMNVMHEALLHQDKGRQRG